jgi:hypothetical protein
MSQETNPLVFSIKVWLTGVFVSPVIYYALMFIKLQGDDHSFLSDIFYIYYFWMFGFLISCPSWFILLILTSLIQKLKVRLSVRKGLLAFFSIPLTIIPILYLFGYIFHRKSSYEDLSFIYEHGILILSYLITIIGGILYFRL